MISFKLSLSIFVKSNFFVLPTKPYNLHSINSSVFAHFQRLTIMRPYRGTGLSQKMMDQADSYVKAQHEKNIFISKVVLFVNIFQEKARRLYERNKFALVQKWDLPMYFGLSTRVLCFYEKKVEN